MNTIKISGISGYNFGDVVISDCTTYLLEKNGVLHENKHLTPNKIRAIPTTMQSSFMRSIFQYMKVFIKKNKILLYCVQILLVLKNIKYYKTLSGKNNTVYFGGGNLLSNQDGSSYLFIAFLLCLLSKPKHFIILFSGVGPFDFKYKFQLSYIEKKSKHIIVRDLKSKSYFSSTNVIVLPDPAILISKIHPFKQNKFKNKIAINLVDFYKFDNEFSKAIDAELIVKNILQISTYYKKEIVFITTSEADVDFTNSICEMINTRSNNMYEVKNMNNYSDLSSIIEDCEYGIVNRMHCGIILSSYSIPTIFLEWQDKISGYTSHIYGDHYQDAIYFDCNFSATELIDKINKLSGFSTQKKIEELQEKLILFKI